MPTPSNLPNDNTPNLHGNPTTPNSDMTTQLARRAQRFGLDQRLPTARGPPRPSRELRKEAAARKATGALEDPGKTARERELERELAAEKKRSRERLNLQAKQARRDLETALHSVRKNTRAHVAGCRDHEPSSHDKKKRRRRETHSAQHDQPSRVQKKRNRGPDHDDQSTLLPKKTKRQRARGHARRH